MTTWYLAPATASPAGSDSNTGAIDSPWLTISKAHASAASGDTIILQASTTAYTLATQTFTKNLTILGATVPVYNALTRAYGGAILNASNAQASWSASIYTINISNLIFTNFNNTSLSLFDIFNLTLTRCVIYAATHFNDYQINSIVKLGINYTALVQSCIFSGILLTSGADNTGGYFRFPQSVTGASLTLYNNAIYDTARIGCIGFRGGSGLTLLAKNNIFVTTKSSPNGVAYFDGTPTASSISGSKNCYQGWTNNIGDATPVTSSPQFVDAANNDLSLRPGSPCINAGVAL